MSETLSKSEELTNQYTPTWVKYVIQSNINLKNTPIKEKIEIVFETAEAVEYFQTIIDTFKYMVQQSSTSHTIMNTGIGTHSNPITVYKVYRERKSNIMAQLDYLVRAINNY